jgi:hypothetical protein
LVNKTLRLSRGFLGCAAAFNEFSSFVELQLVKDGRRPQRAVKAFDREGEQEVALQTGP